jgi:hypothetical protein
MHYHCSDQQRWVCCRPWPHIGARHGTARSQASPALPPLLAHAELEALHAEVAALRAELQDLQDIRADLRNVASLSHSINSMNESYDDLVRLMDPAARVEDIAVIKRLLAEIVMGSRWVQGGCEEGSETWSRVVSRVMPCRVVASSQLLLLVVVVVLLLLLLLCADTSIDDACVCVSLLTAETALTSPRPPRTATPLTHGACGALWQHCCCCCCWRMGGCVVTVSPDTPLSLTPLPCMKPCQHCRCDDPFSPQLKTAAGCPACTPRPCRWEGRMIAKDIVNNHTDAKQAHARKHRHHDHMDAEEVMQSFHAT